MIDVIETLEWTFADETKTVKSKVFCLFFATIAAGGEKHPLTG